MPTPSNPSGIPSLPVVGLLAVILFLGLALAPRAFEFRAWPEAPRHDAVEWVVDRPVAPVIEVAGVEARGERSERRPRRATKEAAPTRDAEPVARVREEPPIRPLPQDPAPARPSEPTPEEPEIVVEVPAPRPDAEEPAPDQPAQIADPEGDQVLRPEPGEIAPENAPAETFVPRSRETDAGAAGESRKHRADRGRGRGHGRGHGHRRRGR